MEPSGRNARARATAVGWHGRACRLEQERATTVIGARAGSRIGRMLEEADGLGMTFCVDQEEKEDEIEEAGEKKKKNIIVISFFSSIIMSCFIKRCTKTTSE